MKITLLFCLIFFALAFQMTAQDQSAEWTRYSSENGELSFEMPSKPVYFYDKDGFSYSNSNGNVFHFSEMQMIQSSADGIYFCVEIYKVSSPKAHLDEMAEKNGLSISKIDSPEKDFTIKAAKLDEKFFRVKKILDRVNYESRFIASKTHLYILTVWNRGKSNPDSERFISSIKLSAAQKTDDKSVSIATLKALTVNDIGGEVSKENAKLLPDKSSFEPENADDLTLLLLPFPGLTGEARSKRINGSVRYLVKYGADGRAEKISLISGFAGGLIRNTFFSVLRIKYLPRIENGKATAVERVVKFSFNN